MKQLICVGVAMLSLAYTTACLLALYTGALPACDLLVRAACSLTVELVALSKFEKEKEHEKQPRRRHDRKEEYSSAKSQSQIQKREGVRAPR